MNITQDDILNAMRVSRSNPRGPWRRWCGSGKDRVVVFEEYQGSNLHLVWHDGGRRHRRSLRHRDKGKAVRQANEVSATLRGTHVLEVMDAAAAIIAYTNTRSHCHRGHELSAGNVWIEKAKDRKTGMRLRCRTCYLERGARKRRKHGHRPATA